MKLALTIIFASVLLSIYGQSGQIQGPSMNQRSGVMVPNPLNGQSAPPQRPVIFSPVDPLRSLDGTIWRLSGVDKANGWVEFQGKVVDVITGGVRLQGSYTGYEGDDLDFFVANFPYSVADNDWLGADSKNHTFYLAKEAGTFTYPTVLGGTRTIRKLNYGEIYVPPPPTPEQIAAAKAAADKAKAKADAERKAAQDKALRYNQDLADKGDAYGLMRMGERYRDGEGVPKDLAKARDYLSKAVTAGEPSAADELSRLDQSTNAPTSK